MGSADSRAAVDSFMATLDHPQHAAVQALREAVLGADPAIAEGIKWNAPSFRTREYFATTHLRTKQGLGLILHLGAKVRDNAEVAIDDPAGLLRWLAKDRAIIDWRDLDALQDQREALQAVVRQWIGHV
jgi:hypothetical protein